MKFQKFLTAAPKIDIGFGYHHEYVFEEIRKIISDEDIIDLLVYPKEFFNLDLDKEKTLFMFEKSGLTKISYCRDSAKFISFPYQHRELELETYNEYSKPWILKFSIGKEQFMFNSIEDSNEQWNRYFKEYLMEIYKHLKARLIQ